MAINNLKKIKVLTIVGTRPEAIKMAPVILKMSQDQVFQSKLCVTAQHRELLDQVLELFQITPDYDLDLMEKNHTLRKLTINVLDKLDAIIKQFKPDWILVQGDTTTVMASALLAYYNKIKIGHVEAGLRTNDIYQPYPEEVNRRIAGVIATLHFVPTEQSRNNLLEENVLDEKIILTGNTVVDAAKMAAKMPFDFQASPVSKLPLNKKYILVTSHRRENFGNPLENICDAVSEISERFSDQYHIIFLVHPNPNVHNTIHSKLRNNHAITLLSPLSYRELIYIIERSKLILTDSGGLQEEASVFKKPVLVLRSKTERQEGIDAGIARLTGTNKENIVKDVSELILDETLYNMMADSECPYGDGNAADLIVSSIKNY